MLGAMGIAMGLIALVMVYTTYLLALKDMRFVKVLLGCTFLQIILLWLFHQTLLEVIQVLILTNGDLPPLIVPLVKLESMAMVSGAGGR